MLSFLRYESLSSTNDEAIRLAREGAPDGTVVWAPSQTAGRGRRGRSWESPEGNLYLSVLARPELKANLAGRLAVSAGQAVAMALGEVSAASIRTKWPNDVLLNERKLGGILVETSLSASGVEWAVVGVGVNVLRAPEIEPPGLPSACLAETGWAGDLREVASAVANSVAEAVRCCGSDTKWEAVCRRWAVLDATNGPVTVFDPDRPVKGVGVGLDADGALLVNTSSGIRRVTTDVSVRPLSK